MATVAEGVDMAGEKKRYGTLIRVSDEFADVLKKAAVLHQQSMAQFADKHLLPVAKTRYQSAMTKESKKLKGGAEDVSQ